jgi:Zn-dependent protease
MSWSVSIGSIAGTAIRIHITFLLFLIWIFAAGLATGGVDAAISSIVFAILLFACAVAHEFGHILTARAFGVKTPDVTLLPIGGIARLERIPEMPSQEFLIAIAGPLVNVAIAAVLIALTPTHLSTAHLAAMESPKVSMIDRLAEVNLFLALFNMIPAFPMDGAGYCGRCWQCGSAMSGLPKSPLRSGNGPHLGSAFSGCSTIRC